MTNKLFSILLLSLILLSCKNKTSQDHLNESSGLKPNKTEQWLTFNGDKDKAHIVLVSGDEEYRSEEALPQLAKILTQNHGFNCTVLFAQDPESPGIINPNYQSNIPGLEQLKSADLLILFTRFRALPNDQMQQIDNYLKSGKPVIGMRTATHAFNFANTDTISRWKHYGNNYNGKNNSWKGGFGRTVLGEKWISHHGNHKHQSTRGIIPDDIKNHEILNGISNEDIWSSTDVYEIRLPLPGDSQPVVLGQIMNRDGAYIENDRFYGMKPTDQEIAKTNNKNETVNNPMMPIAWIKSYQVPGGKQGKAFTTTIGASVDLLSKGIRRLLVNATYWGLNLDIPEAANVNLIGNYQPSQFGFKSSEYWVNQQLQVSDLKTP